MYKDKRLIGAIAINFLIVILEIIAIIGGALHLKEYGFKMFYFYTQDSNLILMISCLIMAIFQLRIITNKSNEIPAGLQRLKFIATSVVTLTFLIVVFVLIPLAGWDSLLDKLFLKAKLYHHFLCPLLAFFSFVCLEKNPKLKIKDTVYALIPTVVYALILTILNILKIVEGPYPFFKVYEQSVFISCIWFITILTVAYGICVMVFFLNGISKRRGSK